MVEVESITANRAHYLPYGSAMTDGPFANGYSTASYLTWPSCNPADTSGRTADVVMRIIGHPEWADEWSRYEQIQVRPEPIERKDNVVK